MGVLEVTNEPPASIVSSTIASNVGRGFPSSALVQGGGILAVGGGKGSVSLLNSTVSENRLEAPAANPAGGGGDLLAVGTFKVGGSVVTGGVGPVGSENCFLAVEGQPSLGFNLESMDQCGFHGNGDQVNKDPLLGPLQDNGGPTATMAPAANSPAVDQGSAFGFSSDQRGVIRPIDFPTIPNAAVPGADGSDIGAVELQPSNAFTLGKLKKNKKKGTATLTVNLPQPSFGTLTLSGKGLKKKTATIAGEGTKKLKVATKGGVRKALRKRGKRKVKIKVTYTPTGNAAVTLSRKTKLVRKRKKHHRSNAKR